MKMKIKLMALCVLIMSLLVHAQVIAAGALTELHFSGTMVDPPCQLLTKAIRVQLGNVSASELYNTRYSTLVPFKIQIKNCVVGNQSNVRVRFVGPSAGRAGRAVRAFRISRYRARGVGIVLFNSRKARLDPGQPYPVNAVADASGITDIIFFAAYQKLRRNVVPGQANATITFELTHI